MRHDGMECLAPFLSRTLLTTFAELGNYIEAIKPEMSVSLSRYL